jgi:hypothetical protein
MPVFDLLTAFRHLGSHQYSFSVDGRTFTDFGSAYLLSWGNYRGDRIGLHNFNDKPDSGWADIDRFDFQLR